MHNHKILIVSHDAGGAEILSSWVRHHAEYKYYFILDGPATEIFQRKMSILKNSPKSLLNTFIQKTDWVLTGTSWASDLEKIAILLAQKQKRKVVSFLDHWKDYPQRFEYEGQSCFPDEIWVGDEDALKIARNFFSQEKLRLVPNPYFQDIKDELKNTKAASEQTAKKRILYVCEPIEDQSIREYGHPLHWGYTEYDAMRLFLEKLHNIIPLGKVERVGIRRHPAEPKNKYDNILHEYPAIPIQKREGNLLIEDCVWADWVVGCESMALVVGLIAEKTVFSCIPPEGRICSLPQKEIIKFNKGEHPGML
jgi:hypothetical protein